ncbi:kappa-type opioid receptor-like [Antedon mediterranea]|uniref:kappa-type opioid receptor-like n=1 Tax=Antedon mediterranea TaxID=105859 RepID=UPI003AF44DD8
MSSTIGNAYGDDNALTSAENSSYALDTNPYTLFERVIITTVMPIVIIIGIIGNVMTIIVIVNKRYMRTAINVYLANLAIADTLYLIASPVFIWKSYIEIPNSDSHVYGNELRFGWLCHLYGYVIFVGSRVSAVTIVWMSIERCMAICLPFQFKKTKFGTISRSVQMCAVIWFLNAFSNVRKLLAYIENKYTYSWSDNNAYGIPNTFFTCTDVTYLQYGMFVDVAFIWTITTFLIIMYTAMLKSLRKSRDTAKHSNGTKRRDKAEKKVFLTLFVTVTVYVLCMFPFYTYFFLSFKYRILSNFDENVFIFLISLPMLNSSLNPLIYNSTNIRFRRGFREIFFRCCKNNTKQVTEKIQSTSIK